MTANQNRAVQLAEAIVAGPVRAVTGFFVPESGQLWDDLDWR